MKFACPMKCRLQALQLFLKREVCSYSNKGSIQLYIKSTPMQISVVINDSYREIRSRSTILQYYSGGSEWKKVDRFDKANIPSSTGNPPALYTLSNSVLARLHNFEFGKIIFVDLFIGLRRRIFDFDPETEVRCFQRIHQSAGGRKITRLGRGIHVSHAYSMVRTVFFVCRVSDVIHDHWLSKTRNPKLLPRRGSLTALLGLWLIC